MIYRSWVKSLGSAAVVILISFGINVITARALGPEGRGSYAALLLITGLIAGICQLGLSQTVIYRSRVETNWPIGRAIFFSGLLVAICSLVLGLIFAVFGFAASKQYFGTAIVLGTVASLSLFLNNVLQIEPKLTVFNVVKIAQPLILLLMVGGLFAYSKIGVQEVAFAQIIAGLLCIFFVAYWLKKNYGEKGGNTTANLRWYEQLSMAGKFHSTTLLGILTGNIDKIYYLAVGSTFGFGLYSIAVSTSRLIGTIQETASVAIFARFAGGAEKELRDATLLAFRISFLPLLVVACFLSSISSQLLNLFFGPSFVGASVPFSILLFESIFGGASWILAQRFNAMGRPGLILARQVLSLAPLLIALPFLPVQNIGIWLAASLLTCSILRLVITLSLYKLVLKEPVPNIFISTEDVRRLLDKFSFANK